MSNKQPIPYGLVSSSPRPNHIVESRLNTQMYAPTPISQFNDYQIAPYSLSHEDEKTLADYLSIIRKHAKFIAWTTISLLALVLIYLFLSTRLYLATATIQINTYLPVLAGTAREDVLRQQTSEDNYISNQVAALRGLPLADKVLSDTDVRNKFKDFYPNKRESYEELNDKGKSSSYKHSSLELEKYLKLFRIYPVSDTSLVRITSVTKDPNFSALLANKHAQQFIEMTKGYRLSDDIKNLDFLKKQAADYEKKLQQAEIDLSSYAEKNEIISFENGDSVEVERLNSAHRALEAATARRIESEAKYQEAQKSLTEGSTIVDDPAITSLRQQLGQAKAEYAELGQRFTAGYPKMVEIRSRINSLNFQIEQQRKSGLITLKAEYEAALQAERKLKTELNSQESNAFKIAKAQVDYNRIKRERDSLRELHQNIKAQLQQTELSVGHADKGNISLVEPAIVPTHPNSPKVGVSLLLALVFGPILGASLALLYDTFDQTLKGPEELEKSLRTPGLGIIPTYSFGAPNAEHDENLPALATLNLVSLREPFSLASEGFRTIRAGIRLSSADRPVEVIVVTSTDQGEGKSTLVSNLGVVCAQDDARTVLIDADLRRATLHNYFGISHEDPGLTEILTGQMTLEECLKTTAVEKLDVIPAGGSVPNPAELVGSKKMRDLISTLREKYDYIIIDTPPVSPVSDSLMLSPLADGVIVVIRAKRTVKKEIKKTVFKLREAGSRILGVVLNGVEPSASLIRNDYLIKSKPRSRFGNPNWEVPGDKAA